MEKNRLFCNKCLADWDKYLIYDYNKADQILHNIQNGDIFNDLTDNVLRP